MENRNHVTHDKTGDCKQDSDKEEYPRPPLGLIPKGMDWVKNPESTFPHMSKPWILKKIQGKQDKADVPRGTLVIVDKDKLAKKIQELSHTMGQGYCSLEFCYEIICNCEVGDIEYVRRKKDHGKVKTG